MNLPLIRNLFLLASFLFPVIAHSQTFTLHHLYHVERMGSARDSLYYKVLAQYDYYVRVNPQDVHARLERCKFMQTAMYDEYEEYNPNYEAAEECARVLLEDFPNHHEVLLYPTEFLYGDSLKQYLLNLEKIAVEDTNAWPVYNWMIFEQLARQYSIEKDNDKTIEYGERAIELNDTLDLSTLLAEAYKTSDKRKGIDLILQHLDTAANAWELNNKGQLLLELGEAQKAIEVFRIASGKNEHIQNSGDLAKAMMVNGLVEEAREYFLKDYMQSGEWNADKTLHALMKYDLAHGPADSARVTYRKLTDLNFFNDPIAYYRLRMIVKDPLMGWTFGDIGRLLLLIGILIIALLLPYMWVLPIHYLGNYLKGKGKVSGDATFRWTLRHFWIVCSLWLICSIGTIALVDYRILVTYFNNQLAVEEMPLISEENADYILVFSIGCALFTLAMLKWKEIIAFFPKLKINLRSLAVGLGLALALRFGMGIYVFILRLFDISLTDQSLSGFLSVKESIISMNQFYSPWLGFLIVVILVPIYEEILFRGIFLSACQRNMKFVFANIAQASVFAIAHEDMLLFPFFLAFGMIAGFYTRKTNSLITSTAMHMTNNLIAFLGILLIQSRMTG